jgi:uncharacterized repeat protein (TIGR03943 family)
VRAAVKTIHRVVTLAVCVAWLGSFAWLFIGGGYTYFLARSYGVLLVIGGAVLVAFTVGVAFGGRGCTHGDAARAAWLPLAILVVPLAILAANPRPMPTSYAFEARAGYNRLWKLLVASGVLDHARAHAPKPGPGAAPVAPAAATQPATGAVQHSSLLDITLDYPGNVGTRVVTEGRVYRRGDLPADSLALFRFVITCCAADAWPAAILVRSDRAGSFAIDSWVRVTGTVRSERIKGLEVPVVHAERIAVIPPPSNPYMGRRRTRASRK